MTKLLRYIFLLCILSIGYNASAQVRVRRYPRMRYRPPNHYVPYNPNYYRFNMQKPEDRVEMIKERFISQQLQLTQEEAEKFLPLYHEYQQELFNIRKLKRLNNTNAANGTDQINKDMYYDAQLLAIKKRFNAAFLKILPPDKVSELYKAEREFNDELVRQLSERNGVRVN